MTEEKMPTALVEDLVGFCTNRAHVYAFLSRCYEAEIDADYAKQIVEHFSFAADNAVLTSEIAAMKEALVALDEAQLEQLAVVFNRVFFGMGPRTAQKAFPYESVYTSEGGCLMQDAYSEIVKVYRDALVRKNPDFPEPEDHLAIELAFMQSLCERCVAALQEGVEAPVVALLEEQRRFLSAHLLNWIALFCADMKGSAQQGFYYHLAAFTEEFLRSDAQALAQVCGWEGQ
ncbi:MAG: molecular chaperone TorD family protein [Raoultibacter sp.]